jgi:endonuclease I
MKRYSALIFILLIVAFSSAEIIAPGIYEDQLWDFLLDNYKTPVTLGYDLARDILYGEIDLQPGNQVSCIYSGFTITIDPEQDPSTQAYQMGIDCEHTWPQSYGADQEPQRSDMHHLYPCKSNVNSSRSNSPFNEIPDVNTDVWYRLNEVMNQIPATNIDEYSEKENDGDHQWEPREDAKGNIARSMFYFYAMYYDNIINSFMDNQMDVLYQWHLQDPADEAETSRTWAIAAYQQNKPNPFVIDDSLIERIWYYESGNSQLNLITPNGGEIWYFGQQYEITWTSQEYYDLVDITLLLNDEEFIIAENEMDDGIFLWALGSSYAESEQYRLRISSPDGEVWDESESEFTLMEEITGGDFVIISEYVEGSGYHKALEIFNGSPQSLDLSGWSLRKQTNGSGSFGNELLLSGIISPWDVFVVCYDNNGVNDLTDEDFVDFAINSQCLTFNGNDAVALYFEGSMVDLVGVVNSSSDWGKDMTLVRQSSIMQASTGYDAEDWLQFPQDTFTNLGFHDLDFMLMYGDIDGNGAVEAYDASLVLQYVVQLVTGWETWQFTAADVDGNSVIDVYDAALILRYVNDIIDIFPVQE